MDNYQETFQTWNKVAESYQDKFMDLDLYNETYDSFLDSIHEENAKILEVGCGPGNITKYLLSKRPSIDVFGIDIAPNMIDLAKKNNPEAQFAIIDSRNIDVIKSKYDGIICGFCLPYLSELDVQKFIIDSYNLLRNDGLLYISFVEGSYSKSGFQVNSNGDRVYFYFHNLDNVSSLLVENNFVGLKTYQLEYQKAENEVEIHTIVIARKGV